MKKILQIIWDSHKNEILLKQRGISFEEIEEIIKKNEVIEVLQNKSSHFENQKILVFKYDDYIWACPCLIENEKIVLKTAFPNRKLNALYSQYL